MSIKDFTWKPLGKIEFKALTLKFDYGAISKSLIADPIIASRNPGIAKKITQPSEGHSRALCRLQFASSTD